MITCDVDHVARTADECRARHAEAVKRAIFREKTKRPAKYDPCRACPEGIEAMKKEKESMSLRSYADGTCVVCGGQKKVFSHSKKCGACTKKAKKSENAPALLVKVETTMGTARHPITVTIPDEYVDRLAAKASAELRTPENQAVWMLMEALR